MEWLICGHLTSEDALKIVNFAEQSIDYNPTTEDQVSFTHCIRLMDKTIYSCDSENELEKSKNNAVCVLFQVAADAESPYDQAVTHVVASLIHEPCFKVLRTNEQLGYSVKLSKDTLVNSQTIQILVQSSKYDAHYLEHRINEFLLGYIEKPDVEGGYQTTFTEKSIDQNKLNIINSLSEEPKNLEAESQSHWQHIVERRLNFDKRKQQIENIKKVTAQDVNEKYQEIFFLNPRRLNLRMHCKDKKFDQKKLENIEKNNKFYEKIQEIYQV